MGRREEGKEGRKKERKKKGRGGVGVRIPAGGGGGGGRTFHICSYRRLEKGADFLIISVK